MHTKWITELNAQKTFSKHSTDTNMLLAATIFDFPSFQQAHCIRCSIIPSHSFICITINSQHYHFIEKRFV